MAAQDSSPQNVVKLPAAASNIGAKSLAPAKPNISALARLHGISRPPTAGQRLATER